MPFAWNSAFLWRYLTPRCSWISVRTKSLLSKDLLGPQIKTTHKLQHHPGRNIHKVHLPTPWSEYVILLEAKGKFGSFDPCPNFSKKKKKTRQKSGVIFLFYVVLVVSCGTLVPSPGLEHQPWAGKAQNPNHWTALKSPWCDFFFF